MKTEKKIQILYKAEGLRIIISPGYFMQQKWQRFFGKNFALAETLREKIPDGLFADEAIGLKERIFYFNNKEQAQDIVLKIVLQYGFLHNRKELRLWLLIYDLCAQHKLYIKAITEIGTRNKLKTMILAGDVTTGLINNL